MSTTTKLLRYTPDPNPDTAKVQVVLAGNYVTGGDALDLSPGKLTDPNGIGVLGEPLAEPATPPSISAINNAAGYTAQLEPGATLNAAKILCYNPDGTQVAAGAYPAALIGATIIVDLPLR